jgi:hypothetical protein
VHSWTPYHPNEVERESFIEIGKRNERVVKQKEVSTAENGESRGSENLKNEIKILEREIEDLDNKLQEEFGSSSEKIEGKREKMADEGYEKEHSENEETKPSPKQENEKETSLTLQSSGEFIGEVERKPTPQVNLLSKLRSSEKFIPNIYHPNSPKFPIARSKTWCGHSPLRKGEVLGPHLLGKVSKFEGVQQNSTELLMSLPSPIPSAPSNAERIAEPLSLHSNLNAESGLNPLASFSVLSWASHEYDELVNKNPYLRSSLLYIAVLCFLLATAKFVFG